MELSKREMDVLQEMCEGSTNAAIAEKLGIKPDTVKMFVRKIFDKLGVDNRTKAVVKAITQKLVEMPEVPEVDFTSLDPRLVRVASLVAQGLSDEEIEKKISYSADIVKGHIREILDLLAPKTRKRTAIAVAYIRAHPNDN